MTISENVKNQIDSMNYYGMLRIWRFAKIGDPLLQGETGQYFAKIMAEKRDALSHEERVQASKDLGW